MAIYLSMSAIEEVSEILCDAYGENSTCAVVYRASHPEEKIIVAPLKDLAECKKAVFPDRILVFSRFFHGSYAASRAGASTKAPEPFDRTVSEISTAVR